MWRMDPEPSQHCVTGSPKRMIQPPGGDSHDLWGAEFKGSPCHNRVLKPPGGGTSDIFGAPEPVQNSPRRVQRSQMQSSLFGPPQDATDTPVRSKPDGNPVTGEGYAAVNGDKESSAPASNNSAPVTNGSTHSAPPQRNRVPPGGYSSGLW
ncbi:microtubule-associated protein Jupiter isoform X5 [Anabrus simplex]|uniref:microtubule-associated protein Jupiter isoform X5 n=1 Tax=Anabrus simplex TaxID=316456 RepID=UPI0034DCCE5C